MEAVELLWAVSVERTTAATSAGMAQAGPGEPNSAQPRSWTPTSPPERHCVHGSPILWDMTMVWAHLSHALAFTCCQIPSGVLVPHSAVGSRVGHRATPPSSTETVLFTVPGSSAERPRPAFHVLCSQTPTFQGNACSWQERDAALLRRLLCTRCSTGTCSTAAGDLPPKIFWFR